MKMQSTLQQDLKRFGLNPQEWVFQKTKSAERIQIQHRRDKSFQFKGRIGIKKARAFFQEIELHSL